MPVVIWELFVFVVRWALANPAKALLLEAGAEGFFGVEQGLLTKWRDTLAAMLNQLSNGEFHVTGADFESWRNVKAALAREIAAKSGIALRDITDRKMVQEDLTAYALQMLEDRTGYRLSSLTNVELLKGDMLRIGAGVVGERTGIVLTNLESVEAIKADLLAWAKDQVMVEIAADVESVMGVEYANGVSMLAYMQQVTGREIKPVELLRGVQSAVMGQYQKSEERIAPITKADRRRLQNKMNQRIFRERHKKNSPTYDGGGLQVYVPKGSRAEIIRVWKSDENG